MKDEREQTCTPKEWNTCRVEKMGCRGCYYDVPKHILTNKEQPLNQHVLRKTPIFYPDKIPPNSQYLDPVTLKEQYDYDCEIKIPEIVDIKKCLHCNNGKPVYCEACYNLLITKITELNALEHSNFPKNTVLKFMNALRDIIISGEKDELKLNKIMQTIIFYEKELK